MYTMVPAELMANMANIPNSVFVICMAICRQTLGFRKEWDTLSYTQIAELTGMSRRTVIDATALAVKDGWLVRRGNGDSFDYSVRGAAEILGSANSAPVRTEEKVVEVPPVEVESIDGGAEDSLGGGANSALGGAIIAPTNNISITTASQLGDKPPTTPITEQIREIITRLEKANGKDRQPILVGAYKLCYGNHDTSADYAKLGWAAKAVGGAGHLVELMCEFVARPPTGDKLAYLVEVHKSRAAKRKSYTNGHSAASSVQWSAVLEGQELPDYLQEEARK
jgi:phage replication O-like protein O